MQNKAGYQAEVLDALWLAGLKLEKLEQSHSKQLCAQGAELRKQYNELLRKLEASKVLDKTAMLESLDEEQLFTAKLLDEVQVQKKRKRIITKNNYEQIKFNLFKEESEGYSKVLIELLEAKNLHSSQVETVFQNLLALIGYFDLDPDRVQEILLDCFMLHPQQLGYVYLLKKFKLSTLPHFLALRFAETQALVTGQKLSRGVFSRNPP